MTLLLAEKARPAILRFMNAISVAQGTKATINFEHFPLWQGVRDRPGGQYFFPYKLEVDVHGYIRQKSMPEVEQQIVEAYSDPGYTFPTSRPGSSGWGNWLGKLYTDFIREHVPNLQGKTMMEIGAGNLFIAEHFLEQDSVARYLIVDPSVSGKSDDNRIQIFPTYFDTSFDPGDTNIDVIISFNCLEHVLDPLGFLQKANELMQSDDARTVLIFPDTEAQFRRGDFNVLCFEHLNYFSEESAKYLITKAGLEIVHFRKELDTLFIVLKRGSTQAQEAWADTELFETAAAKFSQGMVQVANRINALQEAGKTVGLHGACNGLNTLFALNDIRTDNLLIFDGDENKEDMYMPSCGKAVLLATDNQYKNVDILIVSAMTFYDQIRSYAMDHHGIPAGRIEPICS